MIVISITIKDVAKELGVSYSSISRALNGKAGVSEGTRTKILQTAEIMGYQPNDLARGLVNKISKTVGVIIPDINHPFLGGVIAGIADASNENEYNIFLCVSGWNPENEKAYFHALTKKRVDGVILQSVREIEDYSDVKIPLMMLGSCNKSMGLDSVEVDNEMGGYLAVKHLLDCGYQNVGVILGRGDDYASKMQGVERALIEHGLKLRDRSVIEGSISIEGGRAAARQLFDSNLEIDAVFGTNDLIGIGILQYCSENNLNVPEQVGIIGYDNLSYAGLPQIELTTIHQPKYALGRTIFEVLLEGIQKKNEDRPVKKIILTPELKVRKTTCIKSE